MPSITAHRIKEDIEEIVLMVRARIPPRLLTIICLSLCLLVIFTLGLTIGLASSPSPPCSGSDCGIPVYYFITNHSASCPALTGDRLFTRVKEGHSFEGLTVALQCHGGYMPFPITVKCQRRKEFTGSSVLEWSGLPVCYPSSLISAKHWRQAPHARSVSCTGSPSLTECRLQCLLDYVSVEESQYQCTALPCRTWDIQGKRCYRCQSNCTELAAHRDPTPGDLLATLGCDRDCEGIVVTSTAGAAVWQNKRTGLFRLVGEHRGRPVYRKNSTKEFLYYSDKGAEWLVGPDFRVSHGGLQVFHNKDTQCPERFGGENLTRMYIDSSKPFGGLWQEDNTIEFQCYRKSQTPVEWCDCQHYQISLSRTAVGEEERSQDLVPGEQYLEYLVGRYTKVSQADSYGLLAPLYHQSEKDLYLFSHHPEGLVWQVSPKLTTSPLRGTSSGPACPDATGLVWEWYNMTNQLGEQVYVKEDRLRVTCLLQ